MKAACFIKQMTSWKLRQNFRQEDGPRKETVPRSVAVGTENGRKARVMEAEDVGGESRRSESMKRSIQSNDI